MFLSQHLRWRLLRFFKSQLYCVIQSAFPDKNVIWIKLQCFWHKYYNTVIDSNHLISKTKQIFYYVIVPRLTSKSRKDSIPGAIRHSMSTSKPKDFSNLHFWYLTLSHAKSQKFEQILNFAMKKSCRLLMHAVKYLLDHLGDSASGHWLTFWTATSTVRWQTFGKSFDLHLLKLTRNVLLCLNKMF